MTENRKEEETGILESEKHEIGENEAEMISKTSIPLSLKNNYYLTRIVYLRCLSIVTFTAFAVAYNQNRGLIGSRGLTPANEHMTAVKNHFRSDEYGKWSYAPTIFWFLNYENEIDILLDSAALMGMVLSALIIIKGSANMIMMSTIWILYHSIVSVGQRWYSFGWESQTLETVFLSIWMVPLWSLDQFSATPFFLSFFGNKWLIFRIMIGAGLIKIRGDSCWRDLTCMNYHYQTQPVPNPIAFYLHKSPEIIHKFEVLGNHFVELIAPIFIILPFRKLRIFSSLSVIFFMAVIGMVQNFF